MKYNLDKLDFPVDSAWNITYSYSKLNLNTLAYYLVTDKTTILQVIDYLTNDKVKLKIKHIVKLESLFTTFKIKGFNKISIEDINNLLLFIKSNFTYSEIKENGFTKFIINKKG